MARRCFYGDDGGDYDGHQPLQELVCRVKSLKLLTHVEVKTLRRFPAARRELLFPDIID